jgi:chaperonin cofactor prefoldin
VHVTVQAQTAGTAEVAQKVDRAVARAQLQRALSEATIALAALEDISET